jgi:hypothetical protein
VNCLSADYDHSWDAATISLDFGQPMTGAAVAKAVSMTDDLLDVTVYPLTL